MKLTLRKKKAFLQHLRDTGHVQNACTRIGISFQAMYKRRNNDPDLAEAWLDAIDEYEAGRLRILEAECERRALEGVLEPVFYQGETVGAVRKYSDSLLMFRMKKLDPSYRETPQIDVSQSVHLNGPPAARMTVEQKEELDTLSVDQTRQMLRIVSGDE